MLWRWTIGALSAVLLAGSAVAPAAASCSEIILGSILSLTGPDAGNGIHAKRGLAHAASILSKAGGIQMRGKCYDFRIITYDDESDPTRGAELARRLIDKDAVRLIVGPTSSKVFAQVSRIANAAKMPLIQPFPVGPSALNSSRPHTFTLVPPSPSEFVDLFKSTARIAVNTGRTAKQLRTVLVHAAAPYYRSLAQTAELQAARNGMTIMTDEIRTDDPSTINAAASAIRNTHADLLMILAPTRATRKVLDQTLAANVPLPMTMLLSCETIELAKHYGAAADNILCGSHRVKSLEHDATGFGDAAAFIDTFREEFVSYEKREIPREATQAAVALFVIADAFKRAGVVDPGAVRDALSDTDLDTFHGRVRFDKHGRNEVRSMILRQYREGTYYVVAPAGGSSSNLQWPRTGL